MMTFINIAVAATVVVALIILCVALISIFTEVMCERMHMTIHDKGSVYWFIPVIIFSCAIGVWSAFVIMVVIENVIK